MVTAAGLQGSFSVFKGDDTEHITSRTNEYELSSQSHHICSLHMVQTSALVRTSSTLS